LKEHRQFVTGHFVFDAFLATFFARGVGVCTSGACGIWLV